MDEVTLWIKAGDGGKGCESRRRISKKKFLSTGGEGGTGGGVIFRADPNVSTLKSFVYRKRFEAESGSPGGSSHKRGKKGRDLVISVPYGTVIFEKERRFLIRDLIQPGEEVRVLQGGRGGSGNEGGRPAQPGEKGQALDLLLSLKIPADVFLVGLPNTGKSKLLNRLTRAHSKEESYPFSTKSPELGAYESPDFQQIRLCGLPALYRESPEGRGMGTHFLKHLSRAKLLLMVLDPLNAFAPSLREGYEILLEVLGRTDPAFREIPRAVVVNKIDLPEARERVEKEKFRPPDPFFLISAQTGDGIEALMRYVTEKLKEFSRA